MKIATLSALTVLALSATTASALTLFQDPSTGQVFTKAGEGRVAMGDFIDAKTVYLENQAQDSKLAKIASKDKSLKVYAKASKLKFSGTHYLGFVTKKSDGADRTSNFEMRRNYLQVKAYLLEDSKSYMRVTLDQTTGNGDNTMRIKYAYLYLNNVLPYTGMEFGQAHRPWLDYEEHQGWWYRSVDKTFTESKESADLTNSADMGVNLKTKTKYFTSEIGLFNGEGYHDTDNGQGLSAEWRLTAAITGNGDVKRKPHKITYWDLSFWGQQNMQNSKNLNANGSAENYRILGFHTVYNQPSFLIAAQYIDAKNNNETGLVADRVHHNGKGFSFNGELRFGEDHEYALFGRYDRWTAKDTLGTEPEYVIKHALYGVAWEQNKNVKWILNGKYYNPEDGKNYKGSSITKANSVMLTAEVEW